ncbi:MAG: hypothetical protein OXQ28_02350, partial [Acidobacteriota bacterium]|nr:hypothetical protein [Acidobacteriota bacterium]
FRLPAAGGGVVFYFRGFWGGSGFFTAGPPRDYTIAVTDIELSLYADRFEIVSPGRLPNTVTVEKMRTGCRASRNELTRDVLRDYRYIEASGLGVPRKIVAGMYAHNGTDPDLIEEDYSFTVRLWKFSSGQGT